jgi:hypothetical protein
MTVMIQGSQLRALLAGVRVEKAATTVPQNAATDIFTVSGGRVIITNLVGEVTTVIGGTTPALTLVHQSTVGGDITFGTSLTITADEVGTLYAVDGVGNAIETGSSGVVESSAKPIVMAEGDIAMNVSAADATGAIAWTLTYIPLDDGASVTAA